jgi:S1-C subfamily serine protease
MVALLAGATAWTVGMGVSSAADGPPAGKADATAMAAQEARSPSAAGTPVTGGYGASGAPGTVRSLPHIAVPVGQSASPADWAATLERIASSVVSIEIDEARSFDTERNMSAEATGFVVDAKRGLILTNRHVVTPGPVTATATFLNREEVPLYPVYRDPVHDFGLYRYDPGKLKYIHPQALPLVPQDAQVGREIRVVGNNAGEQLSILAGTVARLDRQAPDYGVGRYNDFNTFYIQAASGTSGGSSGSPVVDIEGHVLALNAGGATGAASSFYLPLGRVRRALRLIQEGKPVTRGTLETEFLYRPYDELERLGLTSATEGLVRQAFPDGTGMLVVNDVQPGSMSDGVLEPGDILVRVNGKLVTTFDPLESALDDSVGQRVHLTLSRGGRLYDADLKVGNLDAITPDEYLELGDAVVHTLSYEEARAFHRPIQGVFVAAAGYIFESSDVPRGAIITAVDSKPVNQLSDFIKAIENDGNGAQVPVRYVTIDDPNNSQLRSIRIDRHWFPARDCLRDDQAGYWQCRDLPAVPPAPAPQPASAQLPVVQDSRAAPIAPSLVYITYDMPYTISGVTERYYHGTGLIVDTQRGLIITDRDTVPNSLGDVRLTFADTIEIPGKVVYIHPLHNLAVIEYDPRLIGGTAVQAARFDTTPLEPGQTVNVVGLDANGGIRARTTTISDVEPLQLPLSRTVRFRETNLDVASLVNPPDDVVGVLSGNDGRARALWASFASDGSGELVQQMRGIPSDLLQETLRLVRTGQPLHSLDAEFVPQTLAAARQLGLTDTWVQRLSQADPSAREVLSIQRLVGGSDADRKLQPGDIVLAIDGQPVTQFREVERACEDKDQVRVTVWRANGQKDIDVDTTALNGTDLQRVVEWAGATLQAPYRAMSAQRGIPRQGVYIAYYQYGSPASHYGLVPGHRIVEVDGQPIPNLDAFLRQVSGRPDRSSLRIKMLDWNGAPQVITLKLDRHYWPAYELRRTDAGWQRTSLE